MNDSETNGGSFLTLDQIRDMAARPRPPKPKPPEPLDTAGWLADLNRHRKARGLPPSELWPRKLGT